MNLGTYSYGNQNSMMGHSLGASTTSKKLVPLVNTDYYHRVATSIFESNNLDNYNNDLKKKLLKERNSPIKKRDAIRTIQAPRQNMFKDIVGSEIGSESFSSSEDSNFGFNSKIRRQNFSYANKNAKHFYETARDFVSPVSKIDKNYNSTRYDIDQNDRNLQQKTEQRSRVECSYDSPDMPLENGIRDYIEEEKHYLYRVNSSSRDKYNNDSPVYVRNSMRLPSLESIMNRSPSKHSHLDLDIERTKTESIIQTKKNLKLCLEKMNGRNSDLRKMPSRKPS